MAIYQKPVFIDKPLSLINEEASYIEEIASQLKVNYFSSSSFRFASSIVKAAELVKNNHINSNWYVTLYGPLTFKEGIPYFYWYGIHFIEMLYTIFPKEGFVVKKVHMNKDRVIICLLNNHHNVYCKIIGNFSKKKVFGGEICNQKTKHMINLVDDIDVIYENLVDKIIDFFDTSVAPISYNDIMKVLTLTEKINQEIID